MSKWEGEISSPHPQASAETQFRTASRARATCCRSPRPCVGAVDPKVEQLKAILVRTIMRVHASIP